MGQKRLLSVFGLGVLAATGCITSISLAQDKPSADNSGSLEEVVVTGVRESMRDSLAAKKNSDLISDNITTTEIGQLPDVTIAEELNRLPGVDMTRDRGNDSQASVRGLGPRLVLGLVNGREVASSEPSQDLRWEIFPSEVLSGAQVYKSQDATLVPGGIAATVDIRTLSPLDYHGPTFSLRAGPEYDDEGKGLPNYDPYGYRASAGYITHFTDDFAIAVAGSLQREKNAFSDFRSWGWNTPFNSNGNAGDLTGNGSPDNTTYGLNTEVDEVAQTRAALTATLGWRVSDNLTIKFDNLYSQYTISENQFQAWFGNNILGNYGGANASVYNAPGNSYNIVNGTVVSATLNNAYPDYESEIASYREFHSLLASGLNAAWTAGDWNGQVDLSFSDAFRRNNWEAVYLSDVYPPNLVYNIQYGGVPYAATPGFDPANPAIQSVGGFRQNSGSNVNGTGEMNPEYTHDTLAALALDFSRKLDTPLLTALHFGTRVSDRNKTHHENEYGLCPGSGSTTFTTPYDQGSQTCPQGVESISLANAGLREFNAPGYTAPPMVYGSPAQLIPLVYPNVAEPAGSELLLSHSKVTEQTYEGYLKVDFKSEIDGLPLTGGLGARVVNTQTRSEGFSTTDGMTYTPVELKNNYTDFLPSLNAILHMTETQRLRFGASIAISRPPLDELVTGFYLSPQGNPPTASGGNPLLRPYKADQVDLSYEWYFHSESLFAFSPFYKHLTNIIGATQAVETIGGVQYVVTSESNAPGGNIEGAETTFQTRFFFLPGLLSNLGVYTNYSYTTSNIHDLTPEPNPLPMVGLAKHNSEADLFYDQSGFETRIAWKYHSAFTTANSWVGTALATLAPESIIDASISYTRRNWTVRLQGSNLTNERSLFTNDNNVQNLANTAGYQTFGRSYLIDVGVKF